VDSIFKTNYTTALAYSSFWLLEGGSQGNNCTPQAVILDVGDSLDQVNFPNRTQWTQTALLWNALKTQDLVAALQLQRFVQNLPWNKLGASDGPVNNIESAVFSITVSGYTFNFASQTVTQPPVSFATLFHPSDAQIQKINPTALAALDRMYTYAQGMSVNSQWGTPSSHLRIRSFINSAASRTTKVLDFGPASTCRHPPNLQGCPQRFAPYVTLQRVFQDNP